MKLRASKRTVLEPDARNAKISTNFDGSKYYMGQLLKETLLYLGPTFIKGIVWSQFNIIGYVFALLHFSFTAILSPPWMPVPVPFRFVLVHKLLVEIAILFKYLSYD